MAEDEREGSEMTITGGFGFCFDPATGNSRRWHVGKDGVRRRSDNGWPVNQDMLRCDGYGNDVDGWREGCERCQRREITTGEKMGTPEIIVFECPFLVEKSKE